MTQLNYKHLFGFASYDQTEVVFYRNLYQVRGYNADIDSYIDFAEYHSYLGDRIIPYYRGCETQPGEKTVGFNRIFQLYRGYANSDRAQGQK